MNVILTLASRYSFGQLHPFFKTLFCTSFKGDVVLFGNLLSKRTIEKLQTYGVIVIPYDNEYPYFEDKTLASLVANPRQNLSPNSLRYLLYDAFLKKYSAKYHQVIHSDVRDVIFQNDPFDRQITGLKCFLEDTSVTIAQNEHNRYWIEHGFGFPTLEKIGNKAISCSGFTISEYTAFQRYLCLMLGSISSIPNVGGMDQGIHNYLIYTDKLTDLELVEDDSGAVSTISSFKPDINISLSKNMQVLDRTGMPVSIVHQYDRYFPLLWKYDKRGCFVTKWNYLKQFLLAIKRSRSIKKSYILNLYDIFFGKMMRHYEWR